jgi:predicted RNA-binding Zn-ribbon protein involved in translation (DUF1610 family)
MYKPKENEEIFEIKPIGVRYICEHCGIGEMKLATDNIMGISMLTDLSLMRKHRCTHCNGELLLTKTYPYIEWEGL